MNNQLDMDKGAVHSSSGSPSLRTVHLIKCAKHEIRCAMHVIKLYLILQSGTF